MNELLYLAARAIDAKCRLDDHYLLISITETLSSCVAGTEVSEKFISMLLFSDSTDPSDYLSLLKQLEAFDGGCHNAT